jgi:hypothetical protein
MQQALQESLQIMFLQAHFFLYQNILDYSFAGLDNLSQWFLQ